MHAVELVDTAAVLCLGAQSLLEECPEASGPALMEYWTSSRCRLDAWGRQLRACSRPGADLRDPGVASLAEEVLLSQPHTRSVAAICVLQDARWGNESAAIARNVLAGHNEAVRRIDPLIKTGDGADALQARYPHVSNRARRWTDLLLGYLLPCCGAPGSKSPQGHVIEFAFDAQRAIDFAFDASTHTADSSQEVQKLLSTSLRMSIAGADCPPANSELNHRIAGATLGLFGPEAFDDFGLLRSSWVRRLERSTDETLGMVEGLFSNQPKPIPAARRF